MQLFPPSENTSISAQITTYWNKRTWYTRLWSSPLMLMSSTVVFLESLGIFLLAVGSLTDAANPSTISAGKTCFNLGANLLIFDWTDPGSFLEQAMQSGLLGATVGTCSLSAILVSAITLWVAYHTLWCANNPQSEQLEEWFENTNTHTLAKLLVGGVACSMITMSFLLSMPVSLASSLQNVFGFPLYNASLEAKLLALSSITLFLGGVWILINGFTATQTHRMLTLPPYRGVFESNEKVDPEEFAQFKKNFSYPFSNS